MELKTENDGTTTHASPFNAGMQDEAGLDRLTRLRRLALRMEAFTMDLVIEDPIDMTADLTADEREAQSIVVRDACAIVTAMMSTVHCFDDATRLQS